MILVAGGTGHLGQHLVHMLSSQDQVRVLTRDPARGEGLPAQLVPGDIRDRDAVVAAVSGCSTVISAVHGFIGGRGEGPEAIDRDANIQLIHAAAEHGVRRFVLLSVLDAAPDHPMVLHRMKHAAEQALRATGLAWTIVRPSAYMETWADVLGGKLAGGGPALVFGRGQNPINFVSVRDVAAVVATALADPAFAGVRVDVGGPDDVTLTEFAQRLAAHHGVPGRVKHIPRAGLRMMSALAQPVAPQFARQARAALTMDTRDMTFDAASVRQRFPDIDWRHLADVIGDATA